MSAAPPPPNPAHTGPRSAGEAAQAVTADVRRLVRAEVELAKAELGAAIKARALAIGLLVFAALLGLYILYWTTYAVFAGWDALTPAWAAALLTALVLTIVVVVLGLIARRLLSDPPLSPERTLGTAQASAELIKQRFQRGS